MRKVGATDASRNFSELLDSAEAGEIVTITRGHQAVAEIRPATGGEEFEYVLHPKAQTPDRGRAMADLGIHRDPVEVADMDAHDSSVPCVSFGG